MERREKGEERGREEGKRTRTGGNGVETGRARELRGLCWGGNRGWGDWGGAEAILTKQRARQAVSSFSG